MLLAFLYSLSVSFPPDESWFPFFKACEMGTYGSNCTETCGHCLNFCNNTDGRCHGGCQAGWQGDRCLQGNYITVTLLTDVVMVVARLVGREIGVSKVTI